MLRNLLSACVCLCLIAGGLRAQSEDRDFLAAARKTQQTYEKAVIPLGRGAEVRGQRHRGHRRPGPGAQDAVRGRRDRPQRTGRHVADEPQPATGDEEDPHPLANAGIGVPGAGGEVPVERRHGVARPHRAEGRGPGPGVSCPAEAAGRADPLEAGGDPAGRRGGPGGSAGPDGPAGPHRRGPELRSPAPRGPDRGGA